MILGEMCLREKMPFGRFMKYLGETQLSEIAIREKFRNECERLRVNAIKCDPYKLLHHTLSNFVAVYAFRVFERQEI